MQATTFYKREEKKKTMGLNLVSLMDIFTILVFFLLMNSGDSQEIESAKFITLPDSQAKSSFTNDLLITVTNNDIQIDDVPVVSIDTVIAADGKAVDELMLVLQEKSTERGELSEFEKKNGRSVTILGDQEVPYAILRSVMASCSQENFRDIALAVNQVVGGVVQVANE
ncbi:biopolymer transporter ExbD [Bacterioplanoides sp. SCSIO 12839]|uniref:ExbD/TolR family protein n=1 Tax=Bacterioplanoides sp. SCSIO 12839 TaxID=2829569 RepID=UPI0021074F0E|nr:biopolymer transporter ExbD [Bacterioplanoides sp. SCSIO 12839]UTW48449.1 biopolymer transporter ExbD [Bacterioplanoides sp. SCSIO 12839]